MIVRVPPRLAKFASQAERKDKALRIARREADRLAEEFVRSAKSRAESKTPPNSQIRSVLDASHHDPAKQLSVPELVARIVALAQILKERKFYPYQIELAARICESLLMRDGDNITALMARQMGKTETIGSICAAIAIILPTLAKQFPDSWHLNITDSSGVYRGFAAGVAIGIYAPRLDQSGIMFERSKQALTTKTAEKILKEMGLSLEICNGNTVRLSNGSRILCQTASEHSKIEGETHHLLVAEEAQDISDMKMRKSLHPMVSATSGTIIKVGTATTKKCDFYTAIRQNARTALVTGKRNHFFFPYTVGEAFNSFYKQHVEKEKIRLGEDSDEFRTSYCAEWIFERGMFVTQEQLYNNKVAQAVGRWSLRYPNGLNRGNIEDGFCVVAGIDWGSASDSTVVTTLAVDWNNPLESNSYANWQGAATYTHYEKHVIDWLEFIGDNYEIQFWKVVDYLRGIRNLKKVVTDSNGCGRPIFDRLVATLQGLDIEVEEFDFNRKVKSDGFKSLYGDICGRRITFPAGPEARRRNYLKFVHQMLDLRKDYDKGLMVVAHPDEKDAHDDYPDSTMMAAWGANTPARSGQIDFSDENFLLR